jgi:predicted RNA binding protein YcfA (HicA-like mRNA interferase family)
VRLPRDVSGRELARALAKLGYAVTRQTGSHVRVSRATPTEHHLTIPDHAPIKIGTLNAILRELADANGLDRDELLRRLFEG